MANLEDNIGRGGGGEGLIVNLFIKLSNTNLNNVNSTHILLFSRQGMSKIVIKSREWL